MNRMMVAAAAVCLAMPLASEAQDPPSTLRDEIAPLQFLAGHCWQGVFPGSETFDVHCFEPMFDGQFLRDVHAVPMGANFYRGETIYRWDVEAQIIRYDYFNSDGDVSTGTVFQDGDLLRFGDEHVVLQDGTTMVLATTWQRQGEARYLAVTENITDPDTTQTAEMFSMQFDRITRREAEEILGVPLE